MSYRFMRTILFFDLPSITASDKRHYRTFVKHLKVLGFYRLQESVFCKMNIDKQSLGSTISKIKNKLPPSGNIMVLTVTEKQFSNILIMLGDSITDVINTDERVISL